VPQRQTHASSQVTEQRDPRIPQFFLTPSGPCPYLAGRSERKVFARLVGSTAAPMNEALTQSGFRRSQTIAYRPACDGCSACVSVRILTAAFRPSHGQKRILKRNADLVRRELPPEATREQFALLRTYLDSRHAGGGMSDMSLFDYVAMVEETPIDTRIFEYRLPAEDGGKSQLVAFALTDVLRSGLSMVYSSFHPGLNRRSLGSYMILDHIREAQEHSMPFVYLGYWVEGCAKMEYKSRFKPMEAMTAAGWRRMPD
jgi:leucyl-tRNA---protein transferase